MKSRGAFHYIAADDEYECPAGLRLVRNPDMMRIRRATVEHPFGSLKAWMGSTHFLTRTLYRAHLGHEQLTASV